MFFKVVYKLPLSKNTFSAAQFVFSSPPKTSSFTMLENDQLPVFEWISSRTVARRSSIGGLYVCAGGLTFNFDKNSTDF